MIDYNKKLASLKKEYELTDQDLADMLDCSVGSIQSYWKTKGTAGHRVTPKAKYELAEFKARQRKK